MLDHVTLYVKDLQKARAFYTAALAPLGYEVLMEAPQSIGMGADQKPDLWITEDPANTRPSHLAFSALTRKAVDAFHAAALAAGAKDNGKPGLRLEYHPTYYAAFVLDENGHNIEAVTHRPE